MLCPTQLLLRNMIDMTDPYHSITVKLGFFFAARFLTFILSCLICFDWTYMSKSHISPLCKVKNTPFFLRLFPNHKNQDQQHLFGLSYLCTPASSHHKLQARPCWSPPRFQPRSHTLLNPFASLSRQTYLTLSHMERVGKSPSQAAG